jgi:DNA-binding XRE family transcriptional regulator
MKAAKTKGAKSWLAGKLSNPQFRRRYEEEAQKLAIGEQLMHVRLRAGLTQAQVAKKIGTTASAISRYENSDYDRYEIRTLQKIVQACGGRLEIVLEAGPKTHRAA